MSYLDYSLEIRVDADKFLEGKAEMMSAVATLKDGDSVVEMMRVFTPPVTSETDVKTLFKSLFGNLFQISWRKKPFSMYKEGEFVRIIQDSACHGFPIGSIVRLSKVEDDSEFDECPDVTWLASGYTTATRSIDSRWIGENDFEKVSDAP